MIAEELECGLREVDPVDRTVVGLEYWRASQVLPADLLRRLPAPRSASGAERNIANGGGFRGRLEAAKVSFAIREAKILAWPSRSHHWSAP